MRNGLSQQNILGILNNLITLNKLIDILTKVIECIRKNRFKHNWKRHLKYCELFPENYQISACFKKKSSI